MLSTTKNRHTFEALMSPEEIKSAFFFLHEIVPVLLNLRIKEQHEFLFSPGTGVATMTLCPI